MKHMYLTAIAFSLCTPSLHAYTMHSHTNPQECKTLIDSGSDVNNRDALGNTPLHRCLSAEECRVLIAAGADVNARTNYGATPLHYCHSADIAELLVAAGADVSARDIYGATPLHCCSDAAVCKILLDAGSQVEARDNDGHTPLHLADDDGVVQMLIVAGADINSTNDYGVSILYSASIRGAGDAVRILLENGAKAEDINGLLQEVCHMGHPEVARLLIQHGADVQKLDKDQNTLLHYACGFPDHWGGVSGLAEHRRELIRLLVQAGCSPNAQNEYGNRPLHQECAVAGQTACVEELLMSGADVCSVGCYLRKTDGGQQVKVVESVTALHLAVLNKSYDCIPLLLAAGADTGAMDTKGRTALDYCTEAAVDNAGDIINLLKDSSAQNLMLYALAQDDVALFKLLKNRGVDMSLELNDNLDTPLHLASSVEMVQFLVEAGADVNAENSEGKTPLYYAVESEIVSILLCHGANVNDEDLHHNTALNRAIFGRSFHLIDLLLEAGAELNPQNALPPLHVACACGYVSIVEKLLSKGANPQLKSYQGKTAVDYAKEYSHEEIVELLEKE